MLTFLRTTATAAALAVASWWVWVGFADARAALLHPGTTDLPTLLLGVTAVLAQLVLLRAGVDVAVLVGARLRHRPLPTAGRGTRRLVVLLTGLAFGATLTSPAVAAGDHRDEHDRGLVGLPLPDRQSGAARPGHVTTAPRPAAARGHRPSRPRTPVRTTATTHRPTAARSHVVLTGESLWSIAGGALPRASTAEVAAYVVRLYDANREAIGPDPDLILPGTTLQLPPQEDR